MKKHFRGKLLHDGKIIDDQVEGFLFLERSSEYASFFDITGELKSSKSLPFYYEELFIMDNPPQFELLFDDPIIESRDETSRLSIRFTDINKNENWASFEAGESRRG